MPSSPFKLPSSKNPVLALPAFKALSLQDQLDKLQEFRASLAPSQKASARNSSAPLPKSAAPKLLRPQPLRDQFDLPRSEAQNFAAQATAQKRLGSNPLKRPKAVEPLKPLPHPGLKL